LQCILSGLSFLILSYTILGIILFPKFNPKALSIVSGNLLQWAVDAIKTGVYLSLKFSATLTATAVCGSINIPVLLNIILIVLSKSF